MRSVLITLVLATSSLYLLAQTSIEYAVSRQPVAGVVLPSTQAPILYQGGFDAADDGLLYPVQFDTSQGVSSLMPLDQGIFTSSSTLATWFDEYADKQYVLETGYNCDVVITPAELHAFDRDNPTQIEVTQLPDLFLSDNPETGLAVNGDLFLILRDDYVLAGKLSSPQNVIRHDLSIALPNTGVQRFATLTDGRICIADRNAVYTFSSRQAPDLQTFQQDILGLGMSSNGDLVVYTTSFVYVVEETGQTSTYSHNAAGNSFTSFASSPQDNHFICTYFSPTGDEFVAKGRFENGEVLLDQTGAIDPTNRAFCEKMVVDGSRKLGVIGYYNHDTRLIVYVESGDLEIRSTISVALTTADVEADIRVVQAGDTTVARITYTPVVTNTSDVIIERLDFDASKLEPWYCRSSSGLFYENLNLQPGETRQLDPITIYGFDYLPATNAEVTLQLNAANNFPITPGIARTHTEYPLLVGTSSAFAKTLNVWPNPASNTLHIEVVNSNSVQSAILSDVLGKRHEVELNNGQLDITQLPNGHYTLILMDSEGAVGRSVFVKS